MFKNKEGRTDKFFHAEALKFWLPGWGVLMAFVGPVPS